MARRDFVPKNEGPALFPEASYENPRTHFTFFPHEKNRLEVLNSDFRGLVGIIRKRPHLYGRILHEIWRTGRYGMLRDIGLNYPLGYLSHYWSGEWDLPQRVRVSYRHGLEIISGMGDSYRDERDLPPDISVLYDTGLRAIYGQEQPSTVEEFLRETIIAGSRGIVPRNRVLEFQTRPRMSIYHTDPSDQINEVIDKMVNKLMRVTSLNPLNSPPSEVLVQPHRNYMT